ncbi:hypothetical protein [Nocardia terpenica]|uniref:Uncharacterized protein n=1 Tax=Nocardia terpenica TaxID=455432 RepID=A0A6G9ZFB8_9NOCA|nr:hypothetical protein [Nocardia terpenica]QIS23683.1 hypothetical protein F6W96_40825 [Nocardia terpenica]
MAITDVDVREYRLLGGRTAYAVTRGTHRILVTPPSRTSSPTHWEIWRSRSGYTLARATTAAEGIEHARAILTR